MSAAVLVLQWQGEIFFQVEVENFKSPAFKLYTV